MSWFNPRNEPPAQDRDTDMKDGQDGKLLHSGQMFARDATRPKNAAEVEADRNKVDELAVALGIARDERQARADALAALDRDAKIAREQAATERERIHQAELQRRLDEETELANRRHNLAAWDKLCKERRTEGLPPITFEQFKGEK